MLSLRILVGKILLLTLALFVGATVGREGPSVHVAACCLYLANRFANFPTHHVERGLILAGGAAGIAPPSTPRSPASCSRVEEIGRSFEKANASLIVRTVLVACLVCLAALGHYLFYGRVDVALLTARVAVVPVIGIAGGLLGGVFARAVVEVTPRMHALYRRRPYAVAGSLGLGMARARPDLRRRDLRRRRPEVLALLRGEALPGRLPARQGGGELPQRSSAPSPAGSSRPASRSAPASAACWRRSSPTPRQAMILLAMGAYFGGVVQSPITAAIIIVEMTGGALLRCRCCRDDRRLPGLAAALPDSALRGARRDVPGADARRPAAP